MNTNIKKLIGANMDIDMFTPIMDASWKQDRCPWNESENMVVHKCAVKSVSICPYFCGVEFMDTLLCSYPTPNPLSEG